MPVDVARVVAFLSDEDGGWVNGEMLHRSTRACANVNRSNGHGLRRLRPVSKKESG